MSGVSIEQGLEKPRRIGEAIPGAGATSSRQPVSRETREALQREMWREWHEPSFAGGETSRTPLEVTPKPALSPLPKLQVIAIGLLYGLSLRDAWRIFRSKPIRVGE